jgi:hypothetical protein
MRLARARAGPTSQSIDALGAKQNCAAMATAHAQAMQHADQPTDTDLAERFPFASAHGSRASSTFLHGGEFGLLLTSIGAGDSGLLRNADRVFDLLTSALEERFESVGLPDNTIVSYPNHSDHWRMKDKRYWMAMRLPLSVADATGDEAVAIVCPRHQKRRCGEAILRCVIASVPTLTAL